MGLQESGTTLIELMVATVTAAIVMIATFAFLDAVTHSTGNDEERNIALVEQTAGLQRMVQELSQAYQLNSPTTTGTSNVIDINAWLDNSGSSHQQDRRVVYNCAVASPISGEQECVRYEMPSTDKTVVGSLSSDVSAKSSVAVPRLINGTGSELVFNLESPRGSGGGRPTYGTVTIKTPGSGERAGYANDPNYKYNTTLTDAFYMRNLDFNA